MTCEPFLAVALITGAASGIGAATARLMAPRCRGLVLHTRSDAGPSRVRLAEVAMAAREQGAEVLELTGDLAEAGVARGLVEAAVAKFGGLEHVVANAGYADRRGLEVISRGDFERAQSAMAGAFLEMLQAAAPPLRASPQGRVVYLSSFVAHRFVEGGLFPLTAAAKASGEALVKAAAAELARDGVTVNAVIPGYTRKDGGHSALNPDAWKAAAEATPLGRIAEPEDVAQLIAFLLSPAAKHITGQAIAVDGGLSLG